MLEAVEQHPPQFITLLCFAQCFRDRQAVLVKTRELAGLSFQHLVSGPHLRNDFEAPDKGTCNMLTF